MPRLSGTRYFRFALDFFLPPVFFPLVFFLLVFFLLVFFDDRFRGTFAPFSRASESPIAIACSRLFTLPPLPPRPRLSVPFFRRFIALSTRLPADFP